MTTASAPQTSSTGTWGIPGPVRRQLKNTILELRDAVEDDYRRQLTSLGFRDTGTVPLQAGRALDVHEQRVHAVASAVIARETAGGATHAAALAAFIRDSAFTFLNRAVGLRCLDERGLLLVEGQRETAIRIDAARGASSLYWRVRNAQPGAAPRDLWRETFRRAGAAISERVRVLFDTEDEYAALFPLQPTILKVAGALNAPEIPSGTYAEDEALGWVYQYYNDREKDAAYAKLAKGKKLETPEELAAATCLYTERYMVDYLLQNTLGALWVEMHPDSTLLAQWPYFVKRADATSGEPASEPRLPVGDGRGEGLSGSGRSVRPLRTITLLDPACGSGHFLVRAFDLLVRMYREEAQLQGRAVPSDEEIAHAILVNNLHGIDIDLRAVQIAALALYLKACALAGPDFRPKQINLVAADAVLPGNEPPAEYIAQFQDDPEVQALIKSIWQGLQNVREFGSLLHPERRVDEALQRRREQERKKDPLGVLARNDADWSQLKRHLLESLRAQFEAQAQSADLGQRLFGEHAARGVSLVEALGRRHDVVVMNPPYAGSKNLSQGLKKFAEKEYKEGKRDLYAAFILRCLEFARSDGITGMVTQQSWLFLRSFADLRKEVLGNTAVTTLAHLGEHAFDEQAAAGAFVALFTLRKGRPAQQHQLVALRLIGPMSPSEKDGLLRQAITDNGTSIVFRPRQANFLSIPETPMVYWPSERILDLLATSPRLKQVSPARIGLCTGDNERFIRFFWELQRPGQGSWAWCARAGEHRRWTGLNTSVAKWTRGGGDYLSVAGSYLRNTEWFFREGLTYGFICRGSMSARILTGDQIFEQASMSLFPPREERMSVLSLLNSRTCSYLLRITTQSLMFNAGYVSELPVPLLPLPKSMGDIARLCLEKKERMISREPLERTFLKLPFEIDKNAWTRSHGHQAAGEEDVMTLLSLEAVNEQVVLEQYSLHGADVWSILDEMGTPAGRYPLLAGYDTLPNVHEGDALHNYLLAHERRALSPEALSRLKARLRSLYRADATANGEAGESEIESGHGEGNEEIAGGVLGAHIPIPVETLLEEISQKLGVHPISVHHLLNELREQEGLVSPPEVKRQMEDYASVSVLRLLGYRWPEQDAYEAEHGPIVPPELVDDDGIIPLVQCGDREPTAEELMVTRLEHDFGEDGAHTSLAGFKQYVGRDLGEWLRRDFFRRHIQQFKQRPIAWHLVSPERTFEALVLYHQLNQATLQKLRAQYAGGLIERLRADQQRAREAANTGQVGKLQAQIEDVEEFRSRLEQIERGDDLRARIRCRWKDEEQAGRPGPYAPDIDDGVKVNIRPFQELGLLAVKEVIKKW
jgi:hypothetical protein